MCLHDNGNGVLAMAQAQAPRTWWPCGNGIEEVPESWLTGETVDGGRFEVANEMDFETDSKI
jgi:hypothetical protein